MGAGFGGLRAAIFVAKKLKKLNLLGKYEIILIDKHDYQTYPPTLYEVATTSKETASYLKLKDIVAFPVEKLIKKYPIKFIHNKVEKLNLLKGQVRCAGGPVLKFDYLVLALGSETNYFGIKGLQENSLPLKTFIDALVIRNRIYNAVMSGQTDLQIIIGGGGSTGVELAGEIQEWICELREEMRKCNAKVTIIEAAPTILPGFSEKVINRAQSRLKKLGTQIITHEAISEVSPNKVLLKSGRELYYDVLIWTGGVKAASIMYELPLRSDESKHQVLALEGMECLPRTEDLNLHGKIYGIGDAICFYDPVTEKPIPKVARAAIIQAEVAAHNIIEDIKAKNGLTKKAIHKKYEPVKYPYVLPVGGKYAVAKIGNVVISGFFGWIIKLLIELNYLISIMPFWSAIKTWLRGIKIFIQNDRLG